MSLSLKVQLDVGPDMSDPLNQQWVLYAKMVPLVYSVAFTHEPSAEEMEEAWGILNATFKKTLLARMK